MSKSKTLQVRLSLEDMAKLDILAKNRGVTRSEMLRRILAGNVLVGKVDSSTGAITWNKEGVKIIQADGEVVTVEK